MTALTEIAPEQPVRDWTPARPVPAPSPSPRPSRRRVGFLVALWAVVGVACLGLVLAGLEPLFNQRDQRLLLDQYRADVTRSANEAQGLPGIEVPTKAPDLGAPIAIVEIGALAQQLVAVEGVLPSQTQAAPGHVPGTAAPGQPGNSVLVGRRSTFGAPFGQLDQLRPGDQILVVTTQGESVYEVASVREQTISDEVAKDDTPFGADAATPGQADPLAAARADEEAEDGDPTALETVPVDTLYGPTPDDRLTLVTSASAVPWNGTRATVVVASLQGEPFAPTPQGGRTDSQTGLVGDPGSMAAVILVLLALGCSVWAAVQLYSRSSLRVAYLLSVPPLVVFVILAAESLSRLLPAWM